MSNKYKIDVKLVYETRDINETHTKLKQTLKQIIDTPGLTIFLKEPNNNRYDKLVP